MNSDWLRNSDGKDSITLPPSKPRIDYITEISSYFLHRPRTEKVCPLDTVLNKIEIGHSSIQGYRPHMEDQYVAQTMEDLEDHVLVAVMDGHAGPGAAQFTSRRLSPIIAQTEQFRQYVSLDVAARADPVGVELLSAALVQAYLDMDAQFEHYELRDNSGSTAICAMISPSHILCANVGDSRCVIGTSAGSVITMSKDHKPSLTDENARIERAGGFVLMDRVMGELAMSRAFGDYQYKRAVSLGPSEQMVSCLPDICVHRRDPTDDLLILACDGVWDVMSSAEAVSYLQDKLTFADDEASVESKSHQTADLDISALCYANALVEMAFSEGSTDNITAVVVKLRSVVNRLGKGEEQHTRQLGSEITTAVSGDIKNTSSSNSGSGSSGSSSSSNSSSNSDNSSSSSASGASGSLCESILLDVHVGIAEISGNILTTARAGGIPGTVAVAQDAVAGAGAVVVAEAAVTAVAVAAVAAVAVTAVAEATGTGDIAQEEGTESDSSTESANIKKRKFETAEE